MEAVGEPAAAPRRPERPSRALVLVGFMGAGKSSTVRMLAAELGAQPLDSDREIERELGESIADFFDREGEAAFRRVEEEVVLRLLSDPRTEVIALGGGSLGSERVREAAARHVVVHLEVTPEEAWRRASNKGRPLARDQARFEQLHRDRAALYDSVAHAILPAGDRNMPRRALAALHALRTAPEGTRLVWAAARSGDYPVFLGRGLVASGFFHPLDGRRFAVTDENVARHHALAAEETITIPAGESEKTLARAEEVLRALARSGATRRDIVTAVGGGVVGDMAGFCAAVYQRGMRHVQVPTTLVAQVDSAYGGKTGVDLPEGKNYAGAYHQPSAVIVDPSVLATLPAEEAAAGYVEVVKTALIAGGPLWARVRGGGDPDDDVILGCLRTKLSVVAQDERDEGRRQVLNLGHTVGHAIEAATGYTRYRHGEAVGLGLLCALRLSGRDALRTEVAGLLAARGLPQRLEGATPAAVAELVSRDKKRVGQTVPFVLVQAPGEVTPGHEVDSRSLLSAIEEIA
ncbi:MAG TPA: bifunctional shikimate kinase/3-dehydroquinate synthase [Thermoleophilaceae bacterium]|nr:bifunctional shikimate kinase/3-dehydroquinate synthase [Thermoleophilaceae bacterium]